MVGSAFPLSNEQDDEQVTTALDTAFALWSRGDAREALRWLRRAAEAAGEAGDDWRAVQLARAAADLSSELQIPPTLVPASAGPLGPRSYPFHSQPSGPAAAPLSQPPGSSRSPAPATRRTVEEYVASVPPMREQSWRPAAALSAPRARQAIRVAVMPPEDDGLLQVRVLAEGEALPEGAREALLVGLDPHTNLLSRRRG